MSEFNFGDIQQTAGNGGVNQVGDNTAHINSNPAEDQSSADVDMLVQSIKDALSSPAPASPAPDITEPPNYTHLAFPNSGANFPANPTPELPEAPTPDLLSNNSEHEEMMFQLEEISRLSEEEQTSEKNVGKIQRIVAYCKDHGPAIAQNLAVFGSGALEAVAKSNPIINGIYQVCKANQEKQEREFIDEPFEPFDGPSFGSDESFGANG